MLPRSSSDPAPLPNLLARIFNHAGLLVLAIVLVMTGYMAWPLFQDQLFAGGAGQSRVKAVGSGNVKRISLGTPTTAAISATNVPVDTPTPTPFTPPVESPLNQGVFILALDEGGYSHLFAYHPLTTPLTRLTYGPWNDIAPAVSPDQTRLAFASNRDGYWDLYLLNLDNGEVIRLTDSPEYDGAPSWSPDGQFLAYETYPGNLEIALLSISGEGDPILLGESAAADFSPSWSPSGRQIAFVSDRSGEREIWLADLDESGPERFTNLSQRPHSAEAHPAWSPHGSLAWSAVENGSHRLYVWEGSGEALQAGSGDWPIWSPDGSILLTSLLAPNQTMLTAYSTPQGALILPPINLTGSLNGLAWLSASLPVPLPSPLAQAASVTPAPVWQPALSPLGDMPEGRHHLIPLLDVAAPYPQLHDLVDESFQALRTRLASETGWDLLATLENAFVPLTAPLPPGLGEDWLYTGRAFTFSPLPIDAGWMLVFPEDFDGQTFWQVYARAINQDGSQGEPLFNPPWNFYARTSNASLHYQGGGSSAGAIPAGYWINVTRMAVAYGWERLPALSIWPASYPAARFNEFVLSGGQEWSRAMLELYPEEALVTPTALVPPTLTPTPTSAWLASNSTAETPNPPPGGGLNPSP